MSLRRRAHIRTRSAARAVSLCALTMAIASCSRGSDRAGTPVRVFAAASTEVLLADTIAAFHAGHPRVAVTVNVASSAILAHQVIEGAPADVFLSAAPRWLDHVERAGRLVPGTRKVLFGNRLAVIAPAHSRLAIRFDRDFPFAQSFSGPISLGDPASVPVGIYARQAFERLGWWDTVASRVAAAPNATAALTLVERGECEIGVVYATDTRATAKVRIVALIPDVLHDPIEYGVAIVGRDRPEVRAFVSFLTSSRAADVYRRHGFLPEGEADGEIACTRRQRCSV